MNQTLQVQKSLKIGQLIIRKVQINGGATILEYVVKRLDRPGSRVFDTEEEALVYIHSIGGQVKEVKQ